MPRRVIWALALALLWGPVASVGAAEPVRVSAEGVVPVTEQTQSSLTSRALAAAQLEAVYQLALEYAAEDRRLGREEELRADLAPRSGRLVTRYEQQGQPRRRPDPEDPLQLQYVVPYSITVDGERLRELLRERGWIPVGPTRPSVALRVRAVGGGAGGTGARAGALPGAAAAR